MSAEIKLTPLTDHGRDLLDELERRTQFLPYKTDDRSGARTYYLPAEEVNADWFDSMLDGIDADWREHLTR